MKWGPSKCVLCQLVICLLALPTNLLADQFWCESTISVYAITDDSSSTTANMISIENSAGDCANACGGFRKAYIEQTDRQLLAMALQAAFTHTPVRIQWQTGVTAKGGAIHGTVACKVLTIWQNWSPY